MTLADLRPDLDLPRVLLIKLLPLLAHLLLLLLGLALLLAFLFASLFNFLLQGLLDGKLEGRESLLNLERLKSWIAEAGQTLRLDLQLAIVVVLCRGASYRD